MPILKVGDPTLPSSYRMMTLLSHIRKVVSLALHLTITREHNFNDAEYMFEAHLGAELETVRAASHTDLGHTFLAALDLKTAYSNTRRDTHLVLCRERLSPETTTMVQTLVVNPKVTVRGQLSP